MRWQYCEVEVIYRAQDAFGNQYLFEPEGALKVAEGAYGPMVAGLGLAGWELCGVSGGRTRNDFFFKLFFKRPLKT